MKKNNSNNIYNMTSPQAATPNSNNTHILVVRVIFLMRFLCPFAAILGLSLGHLGAFRAALELSWGCLGAVWGPSRAHRSIVFQGAQRTLKTDPFLDLFWDLFGPPWDRLGPSWGHVRAIVGSLGDTLEPSWAILGPCRAMLGPS